MTMPYETVYPGYEQVHKKSYDALLSERQHEVNKRMSASMAALDATIKRLGTPKDMTDHAAAAAEALEKIVAQLRAGRPPEELGPDVILVGRMMARRT